MRIAIVNGSPRKGNTYTAINAFVEGSMEHNDIDIIEANKLSISPCQGCGACECKNGCIAKDDTNETIDKLVAADMIIFATPVYWWGMTAQLKLVIDKCYCRASLLKNKKVGLIIAGGSPTDSVQYSLINQQFGCIAKYLGWDIIFSKSYYATERTDLSDRPEQLRGIREVGAMIR